MCRSQNLVRGDPRVGSTPTAGIWLLLLQSVEILVGGLTKPIFDIQIRKPLKVLGIAGG